MNPILFPCTWIPASVRGVLFSCFEQVTVFQPARGLVPETLLRLQREGRLDIRLPDEAPHDDAGEKTIDDLPNLLKEYHAWADIHGEEHPAFYKFARLYADKPDDVSTAWIRSRIRNPDGEKTGIQSPPDEGKTDPLLMARLFLAIAQEYDQQSESLARDLFTIDDMERNLLHELTPDEPPTDLGARPPFPMKNKVGDPMPKQRLAAWRLIYAHLRKIKNLPPPTPSPLFITGDRETLDLVMEAAETPEMVCRIVGIPPGGVGKPFVGTAVHQRIEETLSTAAKGDSLSSPTTICFSENEAFLGNTCNLIIYRTKGDPVSAVSSDREGVMKPVETMQADGEEPDTPPFAFLGHILENCSLDSPKQLV